MSKETVTIDAGSGATSEDRQVAIREAARVQRWRSVADAGFATSIVLSITAVVVSAIFVCGCFSDIPAVEGGTEGGTQGAATETLPTLERPGSSSESTAAAAQTSGDGESTSGSGPDPSTGSSSSGTSGSAASTSTTEALEDASSSSTGPGWPHEYHDCYEGEVPSVPKLCDQSCVIHEPTHSACAPDCAAGSTCDGVGAFGGTCLNQIAQGTPPAVCILRCDGPGSPCPEGMVCETIDGFATTIGQVIYACLWD